MTTEEIKKRIEDNDQLMNYYIVNVLMHTIFPDKNGELKKDIILMHINNDNIKCDLDMLIELFMDAHPELKKMYVKALLK